MSQEQFWVLFSKKLTGEASAEELALLETLIQAHPEWQYAIQNLEDLWKTKAATDPITGEDAYMLHLHRMTEMQISFDDITGRSGNSVGKEKRSRRWYWVAASVVLLAGLLAFSSFYLFNRKTEEVAQHVNEISTRPGSKSKVQLPDGSVVWLNAGSKLTYTKDFGKETRDVTLIGEGFFDVTKNPGKPFIISAANIKIKVLGTAFNVKAYPEDKQTETSLIRGSIEVTIRNRPNDKIILSPSEKLVVENSEAKVEQVDKSADKTTGNIKRTELPVISTLVAINKLKYNPADSTVAEVQWVNNKLVFRDEAFSEVVVRMERWYDVQIAIEDPGISDVRLTGVFESETIIQALEALKESIAFQYEKAGNRIIIHR